MQRASPISIAEWTIHCYYTLSWGKNTTNENGHLQIKAPIRTYSILVDTPKKLFEIDSGGDGWYPGLSNVVWLGWKFTDMPHYKRSI